MEKHCCKTMAQHLANEDQFIRYNPRFAEYGITVPDGGSSVIVIEFCPWCGTRLPASKRDEWYDALDELGVDPDSDNIPEEYRSDAWWRKPRAVKKK